MSLDYHPRPGDILLCHFPECLQVPEMVKARPILVLSSPLPGRRELLCIVPLSTTEPAPVRPFHLEIPIARMPRRLQSKAARVWAKCDMLYTFSLVRLDRFKAGRDRSTGRRMFEQGRITPDELRDVRKRAAGVLGFMLQNESP